MTIKKQFEYLMKISGIMSIIHFVIGIIAIMTVHGIGIGLGSLLNTFSCVKVFLHSREIVKTDNSFKENLFYMLKNLKLYFIGTLIIIIGLIIAYFSYQNYLSNFLNNVIH